MVGLGKPLGNEDPPKVKSAGLKKWEAPNCVRSCCKVTSHQKCKAQHLLASGQEKQQREK